MNVSEVQKCCIFHHQFNKIFRKETFILCKVANNGFERLRFVPKKQKIFQA